MPGRNGRPDVCRGGDPRLEQRNLPVRGPQLVVGNPEDPDRIFSSEVVFALSHAKRSQLFLNYFNPARTTFTFRMESDLISKAIFGGGAETGGYQDDYRNRVNWSTSGENRYFSNIPTWRRPERSRTR